MSASEKAAKVMSGFLWNAYEYALPDAPGYMTQLLLKELDKAGLEITFKGGTSDTTTGGN